jgi:hypothetical protein
MADLVARFVLQVATMVVVAAAMAAVATVEVATVVSILTTCAGQCVGHCQAMSGCQQAQLTIAATGPSCWE